MSPGPRRNLRTMWHLHPSNRLATIHQHYTDRKDNSPIAWSEPFYKRSPQNGSNDPFAVLVVDSGGPKDAQFQLYSPGGANVPSWEDTLLRPLRQSLSHTYIAKRFEPNTVLWHSTQYSPVVVNWLLSIDCAHTAYAGWQYRRFSVL